MIAFQLAMRFWKPMFGFINVNKMRLIQTLFSARVLARTCVCSGACLEHVRASGTAR